MDETETDELCTILKKIGLGHYTKIFEENMIGINEVEEMTDEDFIKLGIVSIGIRLKIKQACRNHKKVSDAPMSCIKTFLELQKQRKTGRTKSPKKDQKTKLTRRLYVGWKHSIRAGVYKLISASKGGGQQIVDFNKDLTLNQLISEITDIFFPNGMSEAQDLRLDALDVHLASFSGSPIQETDENGESFTVGNYFRKMKPTPVRIYLHTELKSFKRPTNGEASCGVITALESDEEDTGTPTVTFPRLKRRRLNITEGLSSEDRPSTSTSAALDLPDIHVDAPPSNHVAANTHCPTEHEPIIILHEPGLSEFDHELEMAIRESLESSEPEPSLEGILKWWVARSHLKDGAPVSVVVHRGKLLQSTFRAVSRPNFNFLLPFHVSFSGEIGDDLGGPKREFFRELMKAIKEAILEGPDSNKVFRHDISLLHKKTYETCGTLVAWSILNGGPGLPVFNTDLFSLMTGGDIDVQDFTSVVDSDVRAIFLQIQEATTEEQFEEALSKNSDWLLNQGLAPYNLKIDRKDELLKILFKNEIYFRVHSEISQFIDGLNRVGNFHTSAILRAAKEFKTLFTPNPVNHLTFSGLRQMYKIEFSPVGSNHRQQEDEAIYCFESFCSDCEAGILEVSLEDLLAFWTGASEVPPLGFDHKLRITFNENSQYLLPIAHTCTLVIRLWRGYNDPDQFRCDMIKAITWTGGFHLA